jgi:hypothetical protein
MRINILDPGLNGVAGHHLEIDRTLSGELKSRGHAVCVVAHQHCEARVPERLPAGVGFECLFRANPYTVGTGRLRLAGRFAGYHYGAHVIAGDLLRVPAADMWIWPTLFPHQLRACAIMRADLPISGVIHRLSLPGGWPLTTHMIWRDAARLSRRRLRLRCIGPIEEAMLPDLAGLLSGLGPRVLPVPFENKRPVRSRDRLRTVGFFGHQQGAYRMATIEALAAACDEAGLGVIIHDSSRNGVDETRKGVRHVGYVEDLNALVDEADLIVLPYDRDRYRNALSGIGAVGIACGVPVLAPAGTSIAARLGRYDTGLTYAETSPDAILVAIQSIGADYASFAERARRAAEAWAGTNGIARHADALLGA